MLDGLLGRGFAAKCKSLIKLTRSRIDVIRRKRKATEKFLRKDIADLLANGLDINAYGRVVEQAEGLIVELTLSSCYDFVEQSCDFVLKHLSVIQKVSGYPEECREAVSSLMFAAARFSDLPELRDLRQIFQERYGNSLECFVNQEFAANLNLSSPTLEKKVNLMQEIALEYSIQWDSKAFKQRMSKPSEFGQEQKTSASNRFTDYNKPSLGKDATPRVVKYDVLLEKSPELTNDGNKFHNGKEAVASRTNDHDLQSRFKLPRNGFNPVNGCDEHILKRDSPNNPLPDRQEVAAKKNDRGYLKEGSMLKPIGLGGSSRDRKEEQFEGGSNPHNIWGNMHPQREIQEIAAARKPDFTPRHAGFSLKSNGNEPFDANLGGLPDSHGTGRQVQTDETSRMKPYYNNAIPPPYVKFHSKQKNSTCGADVVPSRIEGNDILKYPDVAAASERIASGLDNSDQERQISRHATRQGRHRREKEFSTHEDATKIPVLKHKSMRRKHSRSRSGHNDAFVEDAGVVTTKSRSRRRDESRRGLQILFDDEQHQNEEEERIIDKLLIHYSKKPSVPLPEKAKRKSKSRHGHEMDYSAEEFLRNGNREGTDERPEMVTVPPRTVSLPLEQSGSVEVTKVFSRAASFQPDRSNAALHVHPKLPDYDDLAARFAALRGK